MEFRDLKTRKSFTADCSSSSSGALREKSGWTLGRGKVLFEVNIRGNPNRDLEDGFCQISALSYWLTNRLAR